MKMILSRFVLGSPKRRAREASNPITIQGINEAVPMKPYKYARSPSVRLAILIIPEIMKSGGSINDKKKQNGTMKFPKVSRLLESGKLCSQRGARLSGTNRVKKKNENTSNEIDKIKFN